MAFVEVGRVRCLRTIVILVVLLVMGIVMRIRMALRLHNVNIVDNNIYSKLIWLIVLMAMNGDLSNQNYQKVLYFMQQRNQDNFDKALRQLTFYEFDLELALRPQNREQQINQMDLLNKYINFLQLKRNEQPGLLRLLLRKVKYLFEVIFRTVAKIILPQSLLITLLYPKFYSTYYKLIRLPAPKKNLRQLLLDTKHLQQKSVLVTISRKEVMQDYIQFFANQEISNQLKQSFTVIGYTLGDRNLQILEGLQEEPQIVICRMNVFQEIVIIKKFAYGQIAAITVQSLHGCFLEGTRLKKKDKAVIKLYHKYRMRLSGLIDFDSSSDEQEPPAKNKIIHDEIEAQNEAYRVIEESEKMKQLQELKEQAPQAIQDEELRKIRLMSIPEQPQQGKFIRFSFRCPNGTTIMRNFQAQEKVDLIYSWVELNDQIQFEQKSRSFEIMFSYPLKPLSALKQQLIGEVFEQQQEKLVIRQI